VDAQSRPPYPLRGTFVKCAHAGIHILKADVRPYNRHRIGLPSGSDEEVNVTKVLQRIVIVPIARAAEIDHWALCMGSAGPARSVQECSVIIDSKRELSDSLPYAYVYRSPAL
jgi:hypothetical protein